MNNLDAGDILYVVEGFKVVKSIINAVIIRKDKVGTTVKYEVSSYQKADGKKRVYAEASLVSDLEIAKLGALTNWRKITKDVETQLNNLTEKSFEPIKE